MGSRSVSSQEQPLPWLRSLPDPPGVSLGVPGAVWGAPGPLHALGCTCRPGLWVWKALHACRAGKSAPVPEAGPPQPARAGGSPQSAFVPALERMDWRQPGSAVSSDTGDPRVRQREGGQVEGWTDGRTDEADVGSPALARPGPVPGLVAPTGPAYAAHTVPAPGCDHQPWRCSHSPWDTMTGPGSQPVPPSPGSSATGHHGAGMGVLALVQGVQDLVHSLSWGPSSAELSPIQLPV